MYPELSWSQPADPPYLSKRRVAPADYWIAKGNWSWRHEYETWRFVYLHFSDQTDIELLLIAVGAIDPIKPGLQTQSKENSNQEASDEEETRGIRGKVEDSDDDLDWD